MAKTLVGIFDDVQSAQDAQSELMAVGLGNDQVRLMSNEDAAAWGVDTNDPNAHVGWMDKVRNWFSALFEDGDQPRAEEYAEAFRRGQWIVVADVDDDQTGQVCSIMQRAGAIDIDRRAALWKENGYQGFDRTARPYDPDQRARELATYRQNLGSMAVPVVQEDVSVDTRLVQRGGVRIHSYVQERPVRELVRLREERVNVQRRPADRPATPADMAFQDRTVDVTAMGEEPVVGKSARVVEEVLVSKTAGERTEAVDETVRRRDVDVRPIAPSQPSRR